MCKSNLKGCLVKKDLTLLIPMYNKAPYIERCVKSISEQTYLDRTKIIVIDDKSTYNSVEILKQAANKYRVPMTLFVNEENLGLSRNIRRLYRMIETDFWTVLDPDDYYVHPERLSRAVEFLRVNPDFSMHACNCYWQRKDEDLQPAFTSNGEKAFFKKYSEMEFFQTSSATFRNFWNDEILRYIEQTTGNQRSSFTQGDGFRNFVAIHYGKVCFDNFIGSFYTNQESGIWSNLTEFDQILLRINSNLKLCDMARDFFHNYETAEICLKQSAISYFIAVDSLHDMMNKLSLHEFEAKKYIVESLNLRSANVLSVMQYLLEHENFFKSLKIQRMKD